MKAVNGHVFKYGDNVDTDVIIPAEISEFFRPGRACNTLYGGHRQGFCEKCQKGRHHRRQQEFRLWLIERARAACNQSGRRQLCHRRDIRPDFYRNAINIGLPIIECPEAAVAINAGDEVEVNFDTGVITDKTTGASYQGRRSHRLCRRLSTARVL